MKSKLVLLCIIWDFIDAVWNLGWESPAATNGIRSDKLASLSVVFSVAQSNSITSMMLWGGDKEGRWVVVRWTVHMITRVIANTALFFYWRISGVVQWSPVSVYERIENGRKNGGAKNNNITIMWYYVKCIIIVYDILNPRESQRRLFTIGRQGPGFQPVLRLSLVFPIQGWYGKTPVSLSHAS